jgi:hypothetical protein
MQSQAIFDPAKIKIIAFLSAAYIIFYKAVFLAGILYCGTKVHSHKSLDQTAILGAPR